MFVKVTPVANYTGSWLAVGNYTLSGGYSPPVPLGIGSNRITIQTAAEDPNAPNQQYYYITVPRAAPSSNPSLSSVVALLLNDSLSSSPGWVVPYGDDGLPLGQSNFTCSSCTDYLVRGYHSFHYMDAIVPPNTTYIQFKPTSASASIPRTCHPSAFPRFFSVDALCCSMRCRLAPQVHRQRPSTCR